MPQRSPSLTHGGGACFILLAGETVGQRSMIFEQVANNFARFQGSTLLSTHRLFYMCNLLPEPVLNPIPPQDLEKNLYIRLGMLRLTLKTLGRATPTAEEPKGTKKPALTLGIMRNDLQSDPRACPDSSTLGIFSKESCYLTWYAARTMKTLGRATGPIVSCVGAAEEPKGTKKPALISGIMRNHVQFAPGACPDSSTLGRLLGELPARLCHVWVQLKSLRVLRFAKHTKWDSKILFQIFWWLWIQDRLREQIASVFAGCQGSMLAS